MATNQPPKHGAQGPNGSAGYEVRDANVKALGVFAAIMATLIIVILFGMKCMFRYVSKVETLGPPAAPFVNERVVPPAPQLQAEPHMDLQDYCQDQEKLITSYAWVDKQAGIVRIPVDQAMEIVLKQGLPARATNAAPSKGAPVPAAADLYHAPAMDTNGPCGYLMEPTTPGIETGGAGG